jgi:DNA repair protein RadA/Sms
MAKVHTLFSCQSCGYQAPKWLGRCPDCGQWNSFVEETVTKTKGSPNTQIISGVQKVAPQNVNQVESIKFSRFESGMNEFDRVMGGGVAIGSLTLIGGEPGIGKSTLLIAIAGSFGKKFNEDKILYVSGEESLGQIASRAKRLGITAENLYLYHSTNWQDIQEQIKAVKPKFFILDSIQTTISSEIDSAPGTVSQIREITYEVMNFAKGTGTTCFIIGHVTKDGNIAGPKILEHMVDTVIYFEGDQVGQYRILRSIKNRFGNTNEVGIFEMQDKGLIEVKNPSQYFLDNSLKGAFGRSVTCILEGTRSIFVEIQALVVENKYGNGRRTTQGLDSNRLSMLVAVIEKYYGIPLAFCDIYVNVVGGIKLTTRESDLAIIASILSSYKSKPVQEDCVFIGEVGLTGEVRSVPMLEMRIKEMAQMNYKKVFLSKKAESEFANKFKIKLIGITQAKELDELIF